MDGRKRQRRRRHGQWLPWIRVEQRPGKLGTGTNEHAIIYGNFADLIIGLWGAVNLLLDPYSLSKSGAMRVTAFQDMDVCIPPHAESFCVGEFAPA